MSARVKQYRKKAVVIEAAELTPDLALACLMREETMPFGLHVDGTFHPKNRTLSNARVLIQTLEGTMRAEVGDFIIKSVKGECYPCKPDIFAATYDEEPATPPAPREPGVDAVKALVERTSRARRADIASDYLLITPADLYALQVAALRVPAAPVSGEPTEMALCEINWLILHPNQNYIFRQHPGCEKCAAYLAPSGGSEVSEAIQKLREFARLTASSWAYGGWKAETHNERAAEMLLRDLGYWPTTPAEIEAAALRAGGPTHG